MRISGLGEFGLIERFRRSIKSDPRYVVKGSGDDCAVLAFSKNEYQLFTCDMLVEGVDFRKNEDPFFVGRKSLAVSVSDIAACGGIPRHCLISLAMPEKTSVEYLDRLFKGMVSVAARFKINIVGGDLSRAGKLTIDVSMLGVTEKKCLVLRSQARKGDIIFVTGPLGGSIKGKHLKFTPRVEEARFLVKNFKINAMIDISDGLAQDLGHILKESDCGAILYESLIPLAKEAKGLDDALYSGEDFELLFTLPSKEARRLLNEKIPFLRPVGEIAGKKYGLTLIGETGRVRNIKLKGFRHF